VDARWSLRSLKELHISKSITSKSQRILTDKALEAVSKLTHLEYPSVQGNYFTDAGLAWLRSLSAMKTLMIGLGHFDITDAGVAALNNLKLLECLDLQGSRVTGRGLEQLKGLKNLKTLWLGKTGITVAEQEEFQLRMPKVKVVAAREVPKTR
jgi:internalin A